MAGWNDTWRRIPSRRLHRKLTTVRCLLPSRDLALGGRTVLTRPREPPPRAKGDRLRWRPGAGQPRLANGPRDSNYLLDHIFGSVYILVMEWDVEFTDEFETWWDGLTGSEQDSIDQVVGLLMAGGPMLGHPYTSKIHGSRHGLMRELRIQHQGRPYRVLYAFDPRRVAILLIGGDKTGQARWYETFIPQADALYDAHLEVLRLEGLIKHDDS